MIRVSAPGKAILMGEHAAVYGRPALVVALDRRVYVEIDRTSGPPGQVILDLPALGVEVKATWNDLRASADRPGLDPSDRSSFVRVAFGEALAAVGVVPVSAVRVLVRSEFPVGSGFGSSAAIAVAVVRAVFELAESEISDERLHEVSLAVERRQHGSPSGVDNATVLRGGVLWVERVDGRLRVSPLAHDAGGGILARLRIYQTGEPAESTGEVVSAVRALRERDEPAFDRRLQVMEETATSFRSLLESDEDSIDTTIDTAIDVMRRFESCLEALGVVPRAVQERIRRIEDSGGAAKVSGAGSLAGPGAGSLLVLHPRPEILDDLGALDGCERLEVQLGGDGLRVDSSGGGAE